MDSINPDPHFLYCSGCSLVPPETLSTEKGPVPPLPSDSQIGQEDLHQSLSPEREGVPRTLVSVAFGTAGAPVCMVYTACSAVWTFPKAVSASFHLRGCNLVNLDRGPLVSCHGAGAAGACPQGMSDMGHGFIFSRG